MFLENNRVHVKAVKVPQNSYTLHSHTHTNLTSSHSEDYDVTFSKKFASGLLHFFRCTSLGGQLFLVVQHFGGWGDGWGGVTQP